MDCAGVEEPIYFFRGPLDGVRVFSMPKVEMGTSQEEGQMEDDVIWERLPQISAPPTGRLASQALEGDMNGLMLSFLGNRDPRFGTVTDVGFVNEPIDLKPRWKLVVTSY